MKPDQWGPQLWNCFHVVALGYPETPSWQTKYEYRRFYTNFCNILPCPKCSVNYKRHLNELPIEPFLESRVLLFEWTVKVHNIVNKELGKKELTVQEAREKLLSVMDRSNHGLTGNELALVLFSVILVVAVVALLYFFRNKG